MQDGLDGTHLQHGLDTSVADLPTRSSDAVATLLVSKASLHQRLAVLDQQLPDRLVADRGDLDELGETIANL